MERVIEMMRGQLDEPLTIAGLAQAAMFSKFHFSRLFRRRTGISPGRFLGALRIQEAKSLLIATRLTVSAVAARVGYTSNGTFTSRFTRSVGVSPAAFRRFGGYLPAGWADRGCRSHGPAVLRGLVRHTGPDPGGPIFVGLFPEPIAEGRPASWTVIDGPGRYVLDKVPPGSWYLLAHTAGCPGRPVAGPDWPDAGMAVGRQGPVTIGLDPVSRRVDAVLEPVRAWTPPVLTALPGPRSDGPVLGSRAA